MESLPDEILLMIFNLISAHEVCNGVAHVCRRWSRVARRRAISINYTRHLRLLQHHPRAILISARLPEPRAFFQSLNLLIPCLRELSVHSEMPLSDDELQLLTRLTNLNHLDVFTHSRILGSSMLPIAGRLSSLVVNEAMPCGFLRAKLLKLQALHMYGRSLHYPPRELKLFLRANYNQLCELTLRCNELTDVMYEVMSMCSNLKLLQLYSCWLMTRVGAMHLIRLQKLCCLHITGARMVRRKALLELLCKLPKSIEELVLSSSWFSDEHVSVLSERLQKLHTLELWRCRASADGLTELVMSLPDLKQFDTDIMLGASNEQILAKHPCLNRVRCCLDSTSKDMSRDTKVKFTAADARYKNAVLRGDGEGYRADLFYYWTQRVQLPTIKTPSWNHLLEKNILNLHNEIVP